AVGAAVGTPYAMAPEQVRGLSADARTDVWALGVFLFEMLAAARPFTGTTVADVFSAILRDPPAPLPARPPEPLRAVGHPCLAQDPARRYQRAADVRLVLEVAAARLRDGDSGSHPTTSAGAPLPPSPLLGLAGASRLVGRERELAQMEHAWTRAANGERQ